MASLAEGWCVNVDIKETRMHPGGLVPEGARTAGGASVISIA